MWLAHRKFRLYRDHVSHLLERKCRLDTDRFLGRDIAFNSERLDFWRTTLWRNINEDCQTSPIPKLLALFPCLMELRLVGLSTGSLLTKMPWMGLYIAILTITCTVERFELHNCRLSSGHLGILLPTCPRIERLTINDSEFSDGWVSAVCQVLLNSRPNYLYFSTPEKYLPLDAFWPDETPYGARDFRRGYRVMQHYALSSRTVDITGAVAVRHALELILRKWIGDEMLVDVKRVLKAGGVDMHGMEDEGEK